ncbi:MAG TPA: MFS transporter [Chryseosolibacter sp.]|nr:MFS transporter [Chryseosolibacter sp.]
MKQRIFGNYEIFIIAILTITQFTIILDFMVLSPLGAILMPELKITPAQFGMVVSAYAFSAGASGLLAAGFADRFDRKKMMLVFYTGFIIGTLLCGLAPDYYTLLGARIFTGIFGGVIGSISFAIVTDLFRMEVRGRVMGFLQMAFAGSQVLGLPIGLYFAKEWGWHSPFIMIVIVSVIVAAAMMIYMKPVNAHLKLKSKVNAFNHLAGTLTHNDYVTAFLATTLLATGGFMLMPFASAFSVNNLGLTIDDLPVLYMVTGIFSMATGPFIGKLTDSVGKYRIFVYGTILSIMVVLVYCNLGITPLWGVMIVSVVMFAGVASRMISSQALLSGVPEQKDRGAFMSINASVQQISGGIATIVAGLIIVQQPSGRLDRYDLLGFVVSGLMLITIIMMYRLHSLVKAKMLKADAHAVRV